MTKLKIKVILGSTRQGRFGEKPAKWIYQKAKNDESLDVELLDLKDFPLPFFDEPVSPSMIKEPYKHPVVAKFTQKIAEADSFIIVTPEYNHGYSAVLKNALDYVYNEWNNKPLAFVSYGALGGARAVEQLRQVAVELQMAPIRAAVHISAFWTLLDTQGNLKTESLEESGKNMLAQLIWWTKALKDARSKD
ncbi:MAG: NAD(P)H-dependent oxidoreductase [Patescibacteria group bacterium]